MTNVQTNLTYADYMKTPEEEHCELIGGELVMFTTPPTYHQLVLSNLMYKVGVFVRERDLGRVYPVLTDVVLSDRDVVKPDILYVSKQRSHILTRENVRGAPDLVVEILSPATAERDRTVKLDLCPPRREGVLDRRPRCEDDHGAAAGRRPLRGQRNLRGGAVATLTDAGGVQRHAGGDILRGRVKLASSEQCPGDVARTWPTMGILQSDS